MHGVGTGVPFRIAVPRITATVVFTAFLAVTLFIAVQGAFSTRAQIAQTFDRHAKLDQAEIALEQLVRMQISEESAVRAYVVTGDAYYREQYPTFVSILDQRARSLAAVLAEERLDNATLALREYVSAQNEWRDQVARPMLSGTERGAGRIDQFTRLFADYEHQRIQTIRTDLDALSKQLSDATIEQVNATLYVRAFWLLVFGLLAILFNAYRSRVDHALESERATTDILQRAIRSEHVALPGSSVGSAYQSATRHVAVGGDIFDVYRLSDRLAMVMVADVSGKGIDAAVLSAFVKFTVRSIAYARRDPATILAELNTALMHGLDDPSLFVSMFLGMLDIESHYLLYASAGHDTAFLRHRSDVRSLEVTGPVLGVMEATYETRRLSLSRGDLLVLTTDGLSEARDSNGNLLGSEGACSLIAQASDDPQLLADELIARVRERGGNHMSDDLAVLAVRIGVS